jgi:hypothetical protein
MNLELEFAGNDVGSEPTSLDDPSIEGPSDAIPLGQTDIVALCQEEEISEQGNGKIKKKRRQISKEVVSRQNKEYQIRKQMKIAAQQDILNIERDREELRRAEAILVVRHEQVSRTGELVRVYFSKQLLFELEKFSGKYSLKNESENLIRLDLVNPLCSIVKLVDLQKIVKILVCSSRYRMSNTPAFIGVYGDNPTVSLTPLACIEDEVKMGQWFGLNGYGPMFVGYSHLELSIHFIYMEDISYSFESLGEWRQWFGGDQKRRGPLLTYRIIAMMGMLGDIHSRGVIHGDMHSLNVFFSKDLYAVGSKVQLIDFGRSVDLNECVLKYGWLPNHVVLAKYLDALAFLRTLWTSMSKMCDNIQKKALQGEPNMSYHEEDCYRVTLELAVDVIGIIFDYCKRSFVIDEEYVVEGGEEIVEHIKFLQSEMRMKSSNDIFRNKDLSPFGAYIENRRVMFKNYTKAWKKIAGDRKEKCLENLFPVPHEKGEGVTKLVGWLHFVTRKSWS